MTAGADTSSTIEVVYYVAASIDGLMAPADGSLDWLAPFEDTGEDHGYTGFYAGIDALVVGARTYEQMLGFGEWPHGDRPVTVMSARELPKDAGDITVSPDGPRVVLERLAQAGHRRIWLVGGGTLAGAFEAEGLIDEYVISYVPVLLGTGMGLFGSGGRPRTLELCETERFTDGVVQCRYRRAPGA